MLCPVCKTQALRMSERQGIEIDYCPECRGVWLDRGELDKIIDRSGAASAMPPPVVAQPAAYAGPPPPAAVRHRDTRHLGQQGYKRKKKDSFLSELFDF